MLGSLASIFAFVSAPVSAQPEQMEVATPATHIERLLDEGYNAATSLSTFSCSNDPSVLRTIKEVRRRYQTDYSEVEKRLGRKPFQSIVVGDCRLFVRSDFLRTTKLATSRLNQVERILRQEDLN